MAETAQQEPAGGGGGDQLQEQQAPRPLKSEPASSQQPPAAEEDSSHKKHKKSKKHKKHKKRKHESGSEDDEDDGDLSSDLEAAAASARRKHKSSPGSSGKQTRLDQMPKMLKRPQAKGRARFYDVEAEVEDDEHAVSDDDLDLAAEEEEAELLLGSRRGFTGLQDLVASEDELDEDEEIGLHERLDRERDQAEVDSVVSRLEERERRLRLEKKRARQMVQEFQRQGIAGAAGVPGAPGARVAVPIGELMPQVHDPKLWLVRCKPGKEQECVLRVTTHVFRGHGSARPGAQKFIQSVFCQTGSSVGNLGNEGGKGYIFVEAYKRDHVIQALQGLGNATNGLNPYTPRLVPIKEMIQAVTVSTDRVQLQPRDFVRVKRGAYKGDLAMIVGTSDHGTQIMVKLVPRIDFTQLQLEREQGPLAAPVGSKRRREGSGAADRPPAKLLDVNELRELAPRDVQSRMVRGARFLSFRSGLYRRGFLFKNYPVRSLYVSDAEWRASTGGPKKSRAAGGELPSTAAKPKVRGCTPEPEEFQLFLQRMRDDDDDDDDDEEDEDEDEEDEEGSRRPKPNGPDVRPFPLSFYMTGQLPPGWSERRNRQIKKQEGEAGLGAGVDGVNGAVGNDDDMMMMIADETVDAGTLAGGSAADTIFLKGDTVIVSAGDLKGFRGTVISELRGKVRMQPLDKRMQGQLLDFDPQELTKFFELGDHVKVLKGEYAGETGLVVGLAPQITVHGDANQTSMRIANPGDLSKTAEVSSGRSALGSYQLYDLVMCRDATSLVGCVVKVELSTLKLLTTRGHLKSVKLQDIARKLHNTSNRNAMSGFDSRNQVISPGDVVYVDMGEHRGRRGNVKHIFRGFVYLHSPAFHQNSGMFVVLGKQVRLVGQHVIPGGIAARGKGPGGFPGGMGGGMGGGGGVPSSPFIGGGMGGGGMGGRGGQGGGGMGGMGGNRDALLRQNVIITKGQYRGLQGLVVNCKPTTVRVEIPALCKTIAFNRSEVQELSSVSGGGLRTTTASSIRGSGAVGPRPGVRAGSSFEAETPSHLLGSQTPAHAGMGFGGGMTPALHGAGGQTPFMDGGMTPGPFSAGGMTPGPFGGGGMTPGPRDVWSAQTPFHSHSSSGGVGGGGGRADEFEADDYRPREPMGEGGHGSSPQMDLDEDDDDLPSSSSSGAGSSASSSSSSSTSSAAAVSEMDDARLLAELERDDIQEQHQHQQAVRPKQEAVRWWPVGALLLYRPEGAGAGDEQEAVVVESAGPRVRLVLTGQSLAAAPGTLRPVRVGAGNQVVLVRAYRPAEEEVGSGQPLPAGARLDCVSVEESSRQAICSAADGSMYFLPLEQLARYQDPSAQ